MQFIKLTAVGADNANPEPVYVAVRHIRWISRQGERTIVAVTGDDVQAVLETPEQIMMQIRVGCPL